MRQKLPKERPSPVLSKKNEKNKNPIANMEGSHLCQGDACLSLIFILYSVAKNQEPGKKQKTC